MQAIRQLKRSLPGDLDDKALSNAIAARTAMRTWWRTEPARRRGAHASSEPALNAMIELGRSVIFGSPRYPTASCWTSAASERPADDRRSG